MLDDDQSAGREPVSGTASALADRFGRRVTVIGRTASARNLEVMGVPVGLPTTGLLEDYEQLIGPARRRFVESPAVLALQSRADAQFLHAFLLHFCSLGARMTEPVEDWIRQASAKCAALGLAAMSRFLAAHAHAEAGHHLMMIEDVRALAELWNRQYRPAVDADALLSQTASPGVVRYCKVHNDNLMAASRTTLDIGKDDTFQKASFSSCAGKTEMAMAN